jgi:hypothetical protein
MFNSDVPMPAAEFMPWAMDRPDPPDDDMLPHGMARSAPVKPNRPVSLGGSP